MQGFYYGCRLLGRRLTADAVQQLAASEKDAIVAEGGRSARTACQRVDSDYSTFVARLDEQRGRG